MRIASFALLLAGLPTFGGAVQAASHRLVPVLLPVHGAVLAHAEGRQYVVRLDPVPGVLTAQTEALAVVGPVPAVGTQIDALYDADNHVLSEVAPAQQYVAGIPDTRIGRTLAVGDTIPDLHFIDQDGHELTINGLRGKTIVLSFFYSRCPDRLICPAISGRFAYLQTRIDPSQVALLEVTVDPRTDSPRQLSAYAQRYGADSERWHLVTGEQHSIADALALFGLSNLEVNPGSFEHEDVLGFIDQKGKVQQLITTIGWSPDDVLATLANMNGLPSNPLQRFALQAIANIVSSCGGSTTAGIAIMDSVVFVLGVAILGSVLAWFARRIWQP